MTGLKLTKQQFKSEFEKAFPYWKRTTEISLELWYDRLVSAGFVLVERKALEARIVALGDTTIHSMHDNVKGKIAAQNQKEILEELLEVTP